MKKILKPSSLKRASLPSPIHWAKHHCPNTIMRSLHILGVVCLCLTGHVVLGSDVETVFTDSEKITGLELYSNGLYWWSTLSDCNVELRKYSRISSMEVVGARAHVVGNDCAAQFEYVVRDANYVYFVNTGRHYKKAVNASDRDPALLLPAGI